MLICVGIALSLFYGLRRANWAVHSSPKSLAVDPEHDVHGGLGADASRKWIIRVECDGRDVKGGWEVWLRPLGAANERPKYAHTDQFGRVSFDADAGKLHDVIIRRDLESAEVFRRAMPGDDGAESVLSVSKVECDGVVISVQVAGDRRWAEDGSDSLNDGEVDIISEELPGLLSGRVVRNGLRRFYESRPLPLGSTYWVVLRGRDSADPRTWVRVVGPKVASRTETLIPEPADIGVIVASAHGESGSATVVLDWCGWFNEFPRAVLDAVGSHRRHLVTVSVGKSVTLGALWGYYEVFVGWEGREPRRQRDRIFLKPGGSCDIRLQAPR